MLVENVLIRPQSEGYVTIFWTSASDEMWSWIFVNGRRTLGPYMAETKNRSVTIPISTEGTFIVEVHDFDDATVPDAVEQKPLVKPLIAWNSVETAAAYHVYHTIFDTGSIESLLLEVPALGMERMEIDCPTTLEGHNGRWHSFRVETVDQFGNESENEIVPYFAADLPPVPSLTISRDTMTGLLSFRIL